MPETVGILTASEIIQILSFFCFIFHLSRVTNTIKAERERLLCSVSDYSVIVKQIPKDTTKEELIHYFNALYPLNEKDWSGRPPVGTYVSFFFSIYRFIYLSIALLRLPSVHLTHYFSIYASLSVSLSFPHSAYRIDSLFYLVILSYLDLPYLILSDAFILILPVFYSCTVNLAGAKVTQHFENSLVPAHLNTWIAECTIHKAIGRYLKAFKDKEVKPEEKEMKEKKRRGDKRKEEKRKEEKRKGKKRKGEGRK